MSNCNMKKLASVNPCTVLCFSPTFGTIETDEGERIDAAQARSLWSTGVVQNSNIAFQRLATQFDFDVEACLKWYKDSE